MWHSFVSSTDIMINRVVLGFVETSWRHPVILAGVLLAFLLLTTLLWIEILGERIGNAASSEVRPIRLRR